MRVSLGQTLYAINDIEVEVTSIDKKDGIFHISAVRKSDQFEYYFQIIGGTQYHYKSDSYFDDDSDGEFKPDSFFKVSPPKGHRSHEDKLMLKKQREEILNKARKEVEQYKRGNKK